MFQRLGRMVFLLFFWIMPVATALAVSTINVPLDHWSYDALDKLEAYGLIKSELKGTRPFTRSESARLVAEAVVMRQKVSGHIPPFVDYLLQRLKSEFKEDIPDEESNTTSAPETLIKPLNELEVRYVYSDGEPRRFRGYRRDGRGIDATEGTPLLYNNEGVVYGDNHGGSLQFSSYMRFANIFSGYIEPLFLARQDLKDFYSFESTEADLQKGYLKISPWNIEIEAGKDSLWWGQGYHGSLLLTNNADAFNMIKISNPSPILLPWFFKYLGPLKYTVFTARLEEDRDWPHPLLSGIRLDFKPFPCFEFGAATTFIHGGEGRPSLTFMDILNMLGFQGSTSNLKADQLAALDARLQLPFLRNTVLYAEYGGEDSGGDRLEEPIFRDIAYLLGIYVPRLTEDGKTDLRFEYANNAFEKDPASGHMIYWYGHFIYFSGYTYRKMIMGHPMGPDAEDYFVRVSRYLRDDVQLGLDFDYMIRGENRRAPAEETVKAFGADIQYDLRSNIRIGWRYSYGTVENFNLKPGQERNDHLFMTTFKWEF